jgi:hypothetical protein
MQLLRLTIGDFSLAYVHETSLTAPFTFPNPVQRVRCAVSGFDFSYPDEEDDLQLIRLEPRVEFDPLVSTTTGQVRIHLAWRDEGSGPFSGRIATFVAKLLLVGE